MRILILGAIGRTGKWVLQKALENGYSVHVLVRVSYNQNPKPKLTISRRSVGKFMLDALKDDSLIGKLPTISSDY